MSSSQRPSQTPAAAARAHDRLPRGAALALAVSGNILVLAILAVGAVAVVGAAFVVFGADLLAGL